MSMTPGIDTDMRHLRLLSVFHFVVGGLSLLGIGVIAVHYFVMSNVMHLAPRSHPGAAGPSPADLAAFLSWFSIFYIVGLLMMGGMLIANVLAGFFLRTPKNRAFIMVVAVLNCFNMPFGTVLGVFTFIVLLRTSVVALFASGRGA